MSMCYVEALANKLADAFRHTCAIDLQQATKAFLPSIHQNQKKAPEGAFNFGGYGGSRTRVRKPLDMNFSVDSQSFKIPLESAD